MANPYIHLDDTRGYDGAMTDHYGDSYYQNLAPQVAMLLLGSALFLLVLKLAGFRAMIGVGRG